MNKTLEDSERGIVLLILYCAVTFPPQYMELVQDKFLKFLKENGVPSVLLSDNTEQYVSFLIEQFRTQDEFKDLLRKWLLDNLGPQAKTTVIAHDVNAYHKAPEAGE